MIISKAPFRISLGGGGTDLPSYYEKYGGFLIAGAIDKHIYVGANQQFYNNYSLKYSKIEIEEKINNIEHKLIREALKLLNIQPGIEITSLADIPAKTGLGSSGAFLVSLLNTLHLYKGETVSKRVLAEEACIIELNILKEHEGKQDKYACAFGGIRGYEFDKHGNVKVIPFVDEDIIKLTLEENLYLFFTGIRRKNFASDALKEQDMKIKKENKDMVEYMHEIKQIGLDTKKAFEERNFDLFGSLLNKHWLIKKKYSTQSTNEFIDKCYTFAMKKGALGGKTIGAPGGGFMMFYFDGKPKDRWNFLDNMKSLGLKHIPLKFDMMGVEKI